ncbi:MAG: ABC transporter ATP-binding protein [Fibromonadaceae bacterium]|jgi:ABC-type sugar transport system ATPase subunit|nr:ABC transporter ATP-binding protein [Fibromonadaceae bacterium]
MDKAVKNDLVAISMSNMRLYENNRGENLELDGFSMDIKGAEFLVLLGPAGCGESAMLRVIAGLMEPTSGTVLFNEKNINEFSPDYRNMAMVFQSQALYPHMSVYKNLEFGLKLANLSKEIISARIAETANLVCISDILDLTPKQLAKPQKQLVAIARALVKRPQVLLLDNPISELDSQLKVKMQSIIKRFCLNTQATVVYATHTPSEAMTLGDRIAYMEKGEVLQIGTSYELYNNPKSEDIARFISYPEMNFLEFETKVEKERYILNLANASYSMPAPKFYEKFAKSYPKAKIGIRAEHLKIVEENQNAIPMIVEMQEFFGSSSILYVSRNSQSLAVEIPLNENYKVGETVFVEFDNNNLHFFADGKFIV